MIGLALSLELAARGGSGANALKFAGTGLRWPTTTLTRSGNNYVAGDFAVGMPDYEVEECWFFFPTFACQNTGAGGETATTSVITIEGMATRVEGGLRTLGTIDDGAGSIVIDPAVSATENGKWVKFTPATPIPAGSTQIFTVAQHISDGTYARARVNGPAVASVYGGTTKDERSQGSTSSLLSTLSGSADYNNTNSGAVYPSAMLVRTPSGYRSVLALGDSKGYGANASNSTHFMTSRMALGFIDIGLDDNISSERVQFNNWCVPGWSFTPDSTVGSQANATACARQLWTIDKALDLNGGRPLADAIVCQHGTNSSTAGLETMLTGARNLAALWRPAMGGSSSTPIYWLEMDAYPQTTDGYNTLVNQSPLNVHQDYPDGGRWEFNEAVGGPDGLGDPTATLRADNTIQDSVGLWRISSADLTTQRDLFAVRAFNTTLASDYSGTGAVSLTAAPTLGDFLSFYDGTNTYYAQVESFTGSGPYTVTMNGTIGALVAANTFVRSTWSGGGLHPGALYHQIIGLDEDDGVVGLKIKLGWVPPASIPVLSGVSITGDAEDGGVLTANYTVEGFPAPSVTFQWQKNGSNISGQTSQTITLDGAGMGLSDGDTISCEIVATNASGSDTEEPSVTYVSSGPVTDFLALINASADSGFFDFTEATTTNNFTALDENGGASFLQPTGSFAPSISATTGAGFDGTAAITRVVANADYDVVFTFVRDSGSTSGNVLDGAPVYQNGSATALGITTRVDGVAVTTRDQFHDALTASTEVTVEVETKTISAGSFVFGRTSAGPVGTVRRLALIRRDDFPSNLAAVRTAAIAAVEAV